MATHWSAPAIICSQYLLASADWVFASSRFLPPLAPMITPMTSNAGPATKPPSTAAPPAMPKPPAAKDPPPKNANVALEAATPLNALIAVPVEAVASADAALYAPNAANAPLAAPVTPPSSKDEAMFPMVLSSAKAALSMRSLLSSSSPSDAVKSTLRRTQGQ